jgi:NAD(P)H-dependent flavin oxidoreductase YrpB (nitropropane dioxygenase family)
VKTPICHSLGIDFPIFAFTHCRDVAAAVSMAGGLGVLGTTRQSPELLELDLRWMDETLAGRPYGVDLLFPAKSAGEDETQLRQQIPSGHQEFVTSLMREFGIAAPKDPEHYSHSGDNLIPTHRRALEKWEVARSHSPAVMASALGPAPPDVVGQTHAYGGMVIGLTGSPDQARRHVAEGADAVVAQGSEAGGHTGRVSTLVLVPQVVDVVPGTPVLAAGGIGDGRQIAASLAMGAQGAWMGSIWLATVESDVEEPVKQKLLRARSQDAVQSRCMTGKPIRMLRTPWVEAWDALDAPAPLPAPLQGMLVRDAMTGIFEHEVEDVMGTAVGEVVGMLNDIRPVRQVMYRLVEEFGEAAAALDALVKADG